MSFQNFLKISRHGFVIGTTVVSGCATAPIECSKFKDAVHEDELRRGYILVEVQPDGDGLQALYVKSDRSDATLYLYYSAPDLVEKNPAMKLERAGSCAKTFHLYRRRHLGEEPAAAPQAVDLRQ